MLTTGWLQKQKHPLAHATLCMLFCMFTRILTSTKSINRRLSSLEIVEVAIFALVLLTSSSCRTKAIFQNSWYWDTPCIVMQPPIYQLMILDFMKHMEKICKLTFIDCLHQTSMDKHKGKTQFYTQVSCQWIVWRSYPLPLLPLANLIISVEIRSWLYQNCSRLVVF